MARVLAIRQQDHDVPCQPFKSTTHHQFGRRPLGFSVAIFMFISPWSQEKSVSKFPEEQPVKNRVAQCRSLLVVCFYLESTLFSLSRYILSGRLVLLFWCYLILCCVPAGQRFRLSSMVLQIFHLANPLSVACAVHFPGLLQSKRLKTYHDNECYRVGLVLGALDIGVDCSIMSATLRRTTTGV